MFKEDFTGECASEDESEEDDDDNSDEEDEVETSRRSLRIKHPFCPMNIASFANKAPSKQRHSAMDKDIRTIQKGYLVDSAINKSLVETKGVKIIQSCESRSMSSKGTLVEKIKSFKKDNKHVFVVLHFESPQHFACLHVSPSTMVYYDSLKGEDDDHLMNTPR